jgi:hypothetical protein
MPDKPEMDPLMQMFSEAIKSSQRLGDDSTAELPEQREAFLSGRLHANCDFFMAGYESSPLPTDDEEANRFVLTNQHSGRSYRITVEELRS